MFETAEALFHDVVNVVGTTSAAAPSAELTPAQLIDRMAATERLVNALQADQARDMAAFADARAAADKAQGLTGGLQGRTIPTEVGLALGVAPMTAATRVNLAAEAVSDHPELLALMGTGRVSMAGLRKALKQTEVLEPEQRRVVDSQLAADAVADRLTPGMLERAATRRTQAADPEAAAKRAARARANRRVGCSDAVDGTSLFWSRLRAEEALLVYNTLDGRARGMRADGDERSIADLMCDLLVESVTGVSMTLQGDRSPSAPAPGWWTRPPQPDPDPWDVTVPDPYEGSALPTDDGPSPAAPSWRLPTKVEVQVVISAATLLGLDDAPAMLRGYGAVPMDVVHEIVAAASGTVLRGLFCDPVDGRLVAMDATTRCFVGGLRQSGSSATSAAGCPAAASSTSTTS